jgi:Protein of unknown function (DUF3634)
LALVLTLALAALVLWALWSAARPRDAFVVRIAAGVPRVARGTVTNAFVAQVGDVCRRHGVRDGAVRGVVKDGRIALAFSAGISAPARQQLRNLWSISGWSA